MTLSSVKWAQWDKTQSRDLLGLFICVCIALCTIVAHNIAQNRPDNFPSYLPDNHHYCSNDVYLREGGQNTTPTYGVPRIWCDWYTKKLPGIFVADKMTRNNTLNKVDVDATELPQLLSQNTTRQHALIFPPAYSSRGRLPMPHFSVVLSPVTLTFDYDLWPWHSNSGEIFVQCT